MSNAMRFGKRSLAGLASGALLLSGMAIVAAQPAQAAGVFSVFCADGTGAVVPGDPGIAGDPTSVDADCSVPAGATNVALIEQSLVNPTAVSNTNVQPWAQMSLSGLDAKWNDDSGSLLAGLTNGTDYILSSDKKDLTISMSRIQQSATTSTVANTPSLKLTGNNPGQVTVTVYSSTAATINLVATNKALQGTFDVAAYGAPVGLTVVTTLNAIPQGFKDDPFGLLTATANTTWVGIVAAFDSVGNLYPLNPTGVGFGADPATTQFIQTPGANRDVLSFTGAPVIVNGNPTGAVDRFTVGVLSNGPTGGVRLLGTNTYTVGLLATNPNLTASSSYVVSSTLGASYTATFDKAEYDRGETATLTVCVRDLGGRIVPDGLAWNLTTLTTDDSGVGRGMEFDFNVETVVPGQANNFEVSDFDEYVSTDNGCTEYVIEMPESNVDFKVDFTPLGQNQTTGVYQTGQLRSPGWTTVLTGPESVTVKVGTGSGPDPVVPTIVISGSRGDGKPKSRKVYVEGVTTELAGQKVTPYFRIGGASSFTKGNNERTVATDGTFKWQRKEGKRISVQFRFGDIKSNTIAFPARVKPSR